MDKPIEINEKELMDYYGYKGTLGNFRMKIKFLRSWILHTIAYSSPHSNFAIRMQKARGVKIGKNCFLNPYVLIDLVYPKLIEIGDNVAIGSNVMIFAHGNFSSNLFLKVEKPKLFQEILKAVKQLKKY